MYDTNNSLSLTINGSWVSFMCENSVFMWDMTGCYQGVWWWWWCDVRHHYDTRLLWFVSMSMLVLELLHCGHDLTQLHTPRYNYWWWNLSMIHDTIRAPADAILSLNILHYFNKNCLKHRFSSCTHCQHSLNQEINQCPI